VSLINFKSNSDDISQEEYDEIKKIINDPIDNEIVESSRKSYFLSKNKISLTIESKNIDLICEIKEYLNKYNNEIDISLNSKVTDLNKSELKQIEYKLQKYVEISNRKILFLIFGAVFLFALYEIISFYFMKN
jgi:flagellar basal body P-ring protein FlgI